jgi:hypothetical protein
MVTTGLIFAMSAKKCFGSNKGSGLNCTSYRRPGFSDMSIFDLLIINFDRFSAIGFATVALKKLCLSLFLANFSLGRFVSDGIASLAFMLKAVSGIPFVETVNWFCLQTFEASFFLYTILSHDVNLHERFISGQDRTGATTPVRSALFYGGT